MLLTSPATAAGAHRHAHRSRTVPQLRGAMITPNWSIPGTPFTFNAEQQRTEIRDVCNMGGDLIRVHVDWSQLQPGGHETIPHPPSYDPSYLERLDQLMSWAAACHIRVIADLVGSPCWSIAPAPCNDSTWIFDAPAGGLYGSVSRFLLARYPQLYALEVWNEANTSFWKGSAADYAAVVDEAVDARNALDSRTKILAGAFLGDGSAYLDQLYQAGMHGQDGISIHPYSMDCTTACGPYINPLRRHSPFRETITATHWVMQLHHDPGGIYLTEFGFATCPAQPTCLDEDTAGRWLALSLRMAASYPYVQGLTVFSMRDFADPADGNPRWDMRSGIMRQNLTPKPAFWAVKREIARLRRQP
jgi:hypothetical protein